MRLWLAFILIFCLNAAAPVRAGPWLREKGSAFSSVSVTGTYFGDFGTASYLEYGLRADMTLGADVTTLRSPTGAQSGSGTLFLRRALGAGKGKHLWAYDLGIGASWREDLIKPHLRTGISWGRGYQLGPRNGWMTVDAAVLWDLSQSQHLGKVDATLGLNFTDRTTGMVQLYLTHLDREFFATVAPSVVIKPRNGKLKIQIGAETPVNNLQDTALKLGIWREF